MKQTATLAVVALALMVTSGSAHADDADLAFLRAMESKGLTQYFASPDAEIGEALEVCSGLGAGGNPDSMAFLIARNRHMTKGQVADFIDTSVDFYCPDVPHPQF